ncbi:hypothetical protein CASFOL_009221 [Castilleja foliolosa]|uniref:Uncharacterized protein n=1 Tax=Castilleja foliolosa TaxID=1961234 RepID=A0ABD3DX80_9LAMI
MAQYSSETTVDTNNNIQEPFKPWKHSLLSPPAKLNILSPNFMKGFLAICIFTIFSLCYFSAFPGLMWRADFNQAILRATQFPSHREPKTNISHIIFGIGGSAETWSRRRHYCELWWKPNATRGHVWLDEPPSDAEPWPETSPPYRVSADTARFRYSNPYGSRSAIRMGRIVKESYELGLENVRWFVMGDDDTVFFPENLVNVLGKYDHREMYYIGSNSESVEQDLEHSYSTAYGGGGIAISRPLAAVLAGILDGCIDRYAGAYGSDQKIGGCMSEIGVPLTKELGFHQMDIRGSPYGLLSAHPLAPLVSLHHLDYIQPLFSDQSRVGSIKKLIQVYNLDPSRTLQHSFCYDPTRNWSISISWGYNVQLYPFLITGKDLSIPLRTFLTWGTWSQDPFTFNTRDMSLKPCERPIVYYFDGIESFGNGNTTTSYKRPQPEQRTCPDQAYARGYSVKGFNVSSTFLDPGVWIKAPRRQCCEIISGSGQINGVEQVRIRACNQGESVTPP